MKPLPKLPVIALEEVAAHVVRTEKAATLAIVRDQPVQASLLKAADRAFAVADEAVRFALSKTGASQQPACRRGCDACCYLHVVVNLAEVLRISADLLERFSETERNYMLDRIHLEIEQTKNLSAEERRKLRLPCPLLDLETRECRVRDVRPVACRGWNSLDAELCNRDRENPGLELEARLNWPQYVLVNKVAEGNREALQSLGTLRQSLDFARALSIALRTIKNQSFDNNWLTNQSPFAEAQNAIVFAETP